MHFGKYRPGAMTAKEVRQAEREQSIRKHDVVSFDCSIYLILFPAVRVLRKRQNVDSDCLNHQISGFPDGRCEPLRSDAWNPYHSVFTQRDGLHGHFNHREGRRSTTLNFYILKTLSLGRRAGSLAALRMKSISSSREFPTRRIRE